MEIWHAPLDLAILNAASEGTAMRHLGIEFTAFGPDWIEATMPVDHRTMQPFKLLHGGASSCWPKPWAAWPRMPASIPAGT